MKLYLFFLFAVTVGLVDGTLWIWIGGNFVGVTAYSVFNIVLGFFYRKIFHETKSHPHIR